MVLPTSVSAKQAQSLKDFYSQPLADRIPSGLTYIANNLASGARAAYNYLSTGQFDAAIKEGLGISSGSSGSGAAAGSAPVNNSPFSYGASGSSNPYDKTINLIRQITAENNAWSAQQAQKQMDFQLYLANTAHQREVADLKAAGLNPVLSAGGNGAPVTSGAMAQADTSGTSAIANIAMAAIEGMQNTAIGVSGSAKNGLLNNPYVKKFLGTAASGLASHLVKSLF